MPAIETFAYEACVCYRSVIPSHPPEAFKVHQKLVFKATEGLCPVCGLTNSGQEEHLPRKRLEQSPGSHSDLLPLQTEPRQDIPRAIGNTLLSSQHENADITESWVEANLELLCDAQEVMFFHKDHHFVMAQEQQCPSDDFHLVLILSFKKNTTTSGTLKQGLLSCLINRAERTWEMRTEQHPIHVAAIMKSPSCVASRRIPGYHGLSSSSSAGQGRSLGSKNGRRRQGSRKQPAKGSESLEKKGWKREHSRVGKGRRGEMGNALPQTKSAILTWSLVGS